MLVEQILRWGEAIIAPPASDRVLESCESRLGHRLPEQLRQLLRETDGVEGEYGLGLIWTAERIATDNTHFRNNADFRDAYMPFGGLVFFADGGNGDQFAVSRAANQEVYLWNHMDDSRMWIAPTVMQYLEDWMTGALKV